jgi:hypothetical protein
MGANLADGARPKNPPAAIGPINNINKIGTIGPERKTRLGCVGKPKSQGAPAQYAAREIRNPRQASPLSRTAPLPAWMHFSVA